MAEWHELLRRDLQGLQQGSGIRSDLKINLEAVLAEEAEAIEVFAEHNMGWVITEWANIDLGPLYLFGSIMHTLAAVYFANNRYFGRKPKYDQARILLTIHKYTKRNNTATYSESDDPHKLHQHEIKIPDKDFLDVKEFLASCDAETRHAVHYDALAEIHGWNRDFCKRAELVITETIDQGEKVRIPRRKIFDPFINDCERIREPTGHEGADYLCTLLSEDPQKRQMQLYWLIRLPIRLRLSNGAAPEKVEEYLKTLRQLSSDNEDIHDGLKETTPQNIAHYTLPGRLRSFYTGKPYNKTRLEQRAYKIRLLSTEGFYYYVDPKWGVKLGEKVITQFASQLDYVALKLMTATPEDLYKEACQREKEH